MSQTQTVIVPTDPAQRAIVAASIASAAASLLPHTGGDKSKALAEAIDIYMTAFTVISRPGQAQEQQPGATAENASPD